jgi:hypothetical protein
MEHAIHLGAKHFISHIDPTSTSLKILKKAKTVLKKVQASVLEDYMDLDRIDSELAAAFEDNKDILEEGEDFNVADALGKALALVKQVEFLFIAYLAY